MAVLKSRSKSFETPKYDLLALQGIGYHRAILLSAFCHQAFSTFFLVLF